MESLFWGIPEFVDYDKRLYQMDTKMQFCRCGVAFEWEVWYHYEYISVTVQIASCEVCDICGI